MDSFLYPLCLVAEDTERSGRTVRLPSPDDGPAQPAPTGPNPSAVTDPARQAETPTRPNDQDWANAAALVMYFALRGGC